MRASATPMPGAAAPRRCARAPPAATISGRPPTARGPSCMYVPALTACADFTRDSSLSNKAAGFRGGVQTPTERYETDFYAIDPLTGEQQGEGAHPLPQLQRHAGDRRRRSCSPASPTAPSWRSTTPRWSSSGRSTSGVGFNAPPMTFEVNGKQYVAILSGLSRVALNRHVKTPELQGAAQPDHAVRVRAVEQSLSAVMRGGRSAAIRRFARPACDVGLAASAPPRRPCCERADVRSAPASGRQLSTAGAVISTKARETANVATKRGHRAAFNDEHREDTIMTRRNHSIRNALLAAQPSRRHGRRSQPTSRPERLANPDKEPHNWLMNHRTYDAQRFSPLARINKDNVKNLKLAYAVALGGIVGRREPAGDAAGRRRVHVHRRPVGHRLQDRRALGRGRPHRLAHGSQAGALPAVEPRRRAVGQSRDLGGQLSRPRIIATDKDTGKIVWETNLADAAGRAAHRRAAGGEGQDHRRRRRRRPRRARLDRRRSTPRPASCSGGNT